MKRGQSGLSLLVAVNKPSGMTSHDVVNCARRVFGERRVGHTGTLDPLATGVLPICVGPATRLDKYLTGHSKRYRVRIAFGVQTTTDDAAGEVVRTAEVPYSVFDADYAASFVESLVGEHRQLPPAYSAVKVNGVKSYEAARAGKELALEFRDIRIYEARLMQAPVPHDAGEACWDVDFKVSKGTYIRSLARDIGRMLGCPAHVRTLERVESGSIALSHAVSLETLQTLGVQAALDPVAALGLRFAFADEFERFVNSGNVLFERQVALNEPLSLDGADACACMGSTRPSSDAPREGELCCIIVGNRLKALYAFDAAKRVWKPECVFSTPVFRG